MERKVGDIIAFRPRGEIFPQAEIILGKITAVDHVDHKGHGTVIYYTDTLLGDFILEKEIVFSLSTEELFLVNILSTTSTLLVHRYPSNRSGIIEFLSQKIINTPEEEVPGRKCDGTCDTCNCEIGGPATSDISDDDPYNELHQDPSYFARLKRSRIQRILDVFKKWNKHEYHRNVQTN